MKNIEVEGGEIAIRNENGDIVIIPKKYRTEVQGMIKDGCHGCIDRLVETLPVMADYAEDGSLLPDDKKKINFEPKPYVVVQDNTYVAPKVIIPLEQKKKQQFISREQPILKADTRTEQQRKIDQDYTEAVLNPSIATQIGEAFQKPLRWLADPIKVVGDIVSAVAPKSTLAKDLPNTNEDVFEYRKKQLNPYTPNKEKINNTINEAISLTNWALLNTLPVEVAAGNMIKSGKNLIKPVSKVVDKVDDITENLKHLEYAKNYYSKYGYNIPENLAEIAKDSKLTDETIQGLVNQHNTFVRGVSTNWDEIAKKNPEILRHLEGKGIDYINNPQAAAEYMSTHVPIQTGYGRAGLDETVFREGKDAIYTSNSIPTAEGYTYGDGYIVKVKRPTDFSSKNRIDWIQNNKLDYFEDVIPILKTPERRGLLQKKYLDDSKNILKTEHLKGVENRNYVLNNQLNNYIKEKGVNRISINGEYSFPGGKAAGDIIFDDVSNIQRRISNKYIDEELRLGSIGKFDEASKLHLNKEKEIYDEIMNYMKNYQDFDPVNRYAHYLHIGTPGQKLLESIEAIRITPDIWKNKSRAHTNVFSKGLSAGSLIPFYLYSKSQEQNKNEQ